MPVKELMTETLRRNLFPRRVELSLTASRTSRHGGLGPYYKHRTKHREHYESAETSGDADVSLGKSQATQGAGKR